MALSYSNVSVEIREISLRDRPEELYTASSKGTVPVLIIPDENVIDESLEIMFWALNNNNTQTWIDKSSNEEISLINNNDTTFKKWLDKYKYHERYPENTKEFYRDQCQQILYTYEKQLKDTKYLLRNDISISDVAIFPFIRQFANVDYPWFENNFNLLKIWLENFCSSDLFLKVMPKYDTWKSTNEEKIIFGDEI